MKRRGFTLIELLVVIAIIAILAAIMFPVFVTAKMKGNQAKCLGNLRQIGTAINLYAGDWGDRLPLCRSYGKVWGGAYAARPDEMYLLQLTLPYAKRNKQVYCCPMMKPNDRFQQVAGWTLAGNEYVSYIWNHVYWDARKNQAGDAPGKMISGRMRETAKRISRAPILWDMPYWGITGQGAVRHNGGLNVVYADGHAKWCKLNAHYDWWAVHSSEGWEYY